MSLLILSSALSSLLVNASIEFFSSVILQVYDFSLVHSLYFVSLLKFLSFMHCSPDFGECPYDNYFELFLKYITYLFH